jgi:3',5'-cyclic AMP phosphodiesterase CpdA
MRIGIFSDLHLESTEFNPPPAPADVVVLAGDISEGTAGMLWAREKFDTPIIYVNGNHELYGQRLPDLLDTLKEEAARLGIQFLENASVEIGGVRFLGATLWTDFRINGWAKGRDPNGDDARSAMYDARRLMNDYRCIRFGPKRKNRRDRIRPSDTLAMHCASREWLGRSLQEPFAGKTVVVTHHAPLLQSVPPRRVGDRYTPYYASHMPELVRAPVDLWIHGHFHTSVDYAVEGTRVISNPRGRNAKDNPHFVENLVITI